MTCDSKVCLWLQCLACTFTLPGINLLLLLAMVSFIMLVIIVTIITMTIIIMTIIIMTIIIIVTIIMIWIMSTFILSPIGLIIIFYQMQSIDRVTLYVE